MGGPGGGIGGGWLGGPAVGLGDPGGGIGGVSGPPHRWSFVKPMGWAVAAAVHII